MTKRPLSAGNTRGLPGVHSSVTAIQEGNFHGQPLYEFSRGNDARINELLNGFYARQNFIELSTCVPEIAAPVYDIARRVASMKFILRKEWNDEIDYSSSVAKRFDELFTTPNPRDTIERHILMGVAYEILTGRAFYYKNVPSLLPQDDFSSIATWWSWPAHQVCMEQRRDVNIYDATSMNDLVRAYKVPVSSGNRGQEEYDPRYVLPVIHGDLLCPTDIDRGLPLIKGAELAIKNLIPVYEARGTIFIKRGAMGFFVSKKTDATGTMPLTKSEKERVNRDFNETYGLTGGRNTVGITDIPLEFIRTAMSISELEPFAETEADAAAIYAVLGVPSHLMPKKDKSTFNNASTDMKTYYTNTIIPWALRLARVWTPFLDLRAERRYIDVDTSGIEELQENKKDKADVDNKNGQTYLTAFLNGAGTLGQWVIARGEKPPALDIYKKYLFEMTPEELQLVKTVINVKQNVTQQAPQDTRDTQTA